MEALSPVAQIHWNSLMARIAGILLLMILPVFLRAQVGYRVNQAAQNRLEKINDAISGYRWEEARTLAEKMVRQYPDWPEAWKVLAGSLEGAGDKQGAGRALEQLVKIDTANRDAWRWLARWKFDNGFYQEARICINRYFSLMQDTLNLTFGTRLLHENIEFAIASERSEMRGEAKKLNGVNTTDDEYFPSLSVDGAVLAFTRQKRADKATGRAGLQEDLYYSLYDGSRYGAPERYPEPVNGSGNDGTQSLSQDGRIMIFTSCNRPDTKGGCDLYYCIRSGDQWSKPVNIGYPVNTRYWESTPFLAQDGRRLLFSSNRPGGQGAMDIWESRMLPDRSWSEPRNLGTPVNTVLNEMSPCLYNDATTLFFASDGHPGMGGLDLFVYRKGDNGTPVITNLGSAVNTRYNEDGLTVNAGLRQGFFSSDRDSAMGKDIYVADISAFLPAKPIFTISGKISDVSTGKPLEARIEVRPHGDTLVSRVNSDPVSGGYLLGIPRRPSYRFGVSASGYLPYSGLQVADTLSTDNGLTVNVTMEPIVVGVSVVLRNTFFKHDSYELLSESESDLNEVVALMQQNPGMMIEIAGYTDNTGGDAYNLELSRKRAESVRQYLKGHGISGDRVLARGYGNAKPIATNDSEEGRAMNRRTEMRVVKKG